MATLGDTLAAARRSSAGLEQWLRRTDPALADEAAAAAARIGISVSGYARMAIADFTRLAGEEDWATLMSGLRDSQDPGTTCLAAERSLMDLCGGGTEGLARLQLLAQVVRFLVVLQS